MPDARRSFNVGAKEILWLLGFRVLIVAVEPAQQHARIRCADFQSNLPAGLLCVDDSKAIDGDAILAHIVGQLIDDRRKVIKNDRDAPLSRWIVLDRPTMPGRA